jgi:hypothetical protein
MQSTISQIDISIEMYGILDRQHLSLEWYLRTATW